MSSHRILLSFSHFVLSLTFLFKKVMVSIQALVFVSEPYFNEPGYEATMGTPRGDIASVFYNKTTIDSNVRHAILEMIR